MSEKRVWSIDVPVYATAYVWAVSAEEARALVAPIAAGYEDPHDYIFNAFISDKPIVDPDDENPVTISPAMSMQPLADDDEASEAD